MFMILGNKQLNKISPIIKNVEEIVRGISSLSCLCDDEQL